jgi:hypothetical protein
MNDEALGRMSSFSNLGLSESEHVLLFSAKLQGLLGGISKFAREYQHDSVSMCCRASGHIKKWIIQLQATHADI